MIIKGWVERFVDIELYIENKFGEWISYVILW